MRKARKLDFGNEPEPEDQDASWCPDHWSSNAMMHWNRYVRSDGLQIDMDVLFPDLTLEEIDQRFPLGTGENKLLMISCTDYQECGIVVLDSRLPVKEEVRKGSKQGCYIVRSN